MPFLSPKSSNTGILETKSNKILDRALRLRLLLCWVLGGRRGGGDRGAAPRVRKPPGRLHAPPRSSRAPGGAAVVPQPRPALRHAGQWAPRAAGRGRVAAEGNEEAAGRAGPSPCGGGRGLCCPLRNRFLTGSPGGMEPAGSEGRGAVRELR